MRLIKIVLLITFNYSFSQEFDVSEFKINNSEILIEEVSAIGLDSEDNIYIYHRGKNPLIKVSKNGELLKVFNDQIFPNSHGLKIDKYDKIWTTDLNTNMVTKLDKYGEVDMVIGKKNRPGTWLVSPQDLNGFTDYKSMPLFNKPADIAFDSKDNIYIADGYGNNRIVKFSPDGDYILEWGTYGKKDGEFHLPHGITIDDDDLIYVADRENSRIQIFNSNGKYLKKWEGVGYPYGLKYHDNFIYMTDARNEKIKKIDLDGNIIWEFGSPGREIGEFGWAHGIDISKDGSIYITEILNWRIQKISIKNENY